LNPECFDWNQSAMIAIADHFTGISRCILLSV
jgi:hypothetical protein